MDTIQDQVIKDFYKSLMAKKEKLIRERLIQKGFSHLLEELDQTLSLNLPIRFNRIVIEYNGKEERYYADNGTREGVLLITFLTLPPNLNSSLEDPRKTTFKLTQEIKYY